MPLPAFETGDLPPGIHPATIREVADRFGSVSSRRRNIAARLERILNLAAATGHLARLVVFGSFVTDKPEPNDVDVFLLMEDSFDVSKLTGEAALLFDHAAADTHLGASVFWMRKLAALGGEDEALAHWQIRRDGGLRGIVEIISEIT